MLARSKGHYISRPVIALEPEAAGLRPAAPLVKDFGMKCRVKMAL